MYHVAVCDDDKLICAEIEKILLNYGAKQVSAVHVDVYSDGSSFIDAVEKGEYYDLVFLDIEMKSKMMMN